MISHTFKNGNNEVNGLQMLDIIKEGNIWEAEYQKYINNHDQKSFIDQKMIDQLEDDFLKQASLMISYHQQNANASLMKNEQIKLEQIVESLNKIIDEAIEREYKYWNAELANAKSDADKAELLAMISCAISFLLIMIFSAYLSRKIASPIIELRDITSNVANGNLDIRANINSEDEIGNLGSAINNMIVSLRKGKIISKKMQNINAEKLIHVGLFHRALAQLKIYLINHCRLVKMQFYYENFLMKYIQHFDETLDIDHSNSKHEVEKIKNNNLVYRVEKNVDSILENIENLQNETTDSIDILSEFVKNLELLSMGSNNENELDIHSFFDFITSEKLMAMNNQQKLTLAIEELPKLQCNPSKLVHALVNILDNAFYAIAKGGEIIVRGEQKKGEIILRIQDSGVGISPENRKEIFKPFWTTKPHGIGLGLHVAQEFIQEEGGSIEVESEVGKGTSFIIKLPIAKKDKLMTA